MSKVYIRLNSYWSRNLQRRMHKLKVPGTRTSIIVDDDNLEEIVKLARRALGDERNDGHGETSAPEPDHRNVA